MSNLNCLVSNKKLESRVVEGVGLSLQENYEDFPRLPTYIFPVDYSLAGGIPFNVMSMLYAGFGGGKTTTSYLIAKALSQTCINCLKPATICDCADGPKIQKTFLCHTEGMPPDQFYFDTLGYDTKNNMVIGLPDTGEEACYMVEEAVKSDDCGLVIVDSAANIYPSQIYDSDYEDLNVGGQAKLLTKFSARISHQLVLEARRGHKVAVVVLNQVRSNIGAGKYEAQETIPGGWSLKHNCRLMVRMGQVKSENMDETVNLKDAARFTFSTLGPQGKQQLLILAGKCEYKIALRDFNGYVSGQVIDHKPTISIAKDTLGIFAKGDKYYELAGTFMKFRILSDVEEMFKTGDYVDPETGEVTAHGDAIFRYVVMTEAKNRAVKNILARKSARIINLGGEQPAAKCA